MCVLDLYISAIEQTKNEIKETESKYADCELRQQELREANHEIISKINEIVNNRNNNNLQHSERLNNFQAALNEKKAEYEKSARLLQNKKDELCITMSLRGKS
jgi:hypothetical protein